MGDYSINLKFTSEQIKKYNGEGLKLCFASGVAESSDYNMVAWCDTIASEVEITWRDTYLIAGTKKLFSHGVAFKDKTTTASIKFQDVYTLPADWEDGTISSDPKLGTGTFKFVNMTDKEVSAVVYKLVNGAPTPFYISGTPIFSLGNETMTPKLTVALWFEKDAETGTMLSKDSSAVTEINMANRSSFNGTWTGAKFIPV